MYPNATSGLTVLIVLTICWIKVDNLFFRLERWCASSAGSQYSYGRQNTYQRTISQDSNANSTRSESDTFINCQKDSQWLLGPTTELTTAQLLNNHDVTSPSPLPPPRKFIPYRPPQHSLSLSTNTTPRNSGRSFSPARSNSPSVSTMGR